jgi:formylglycine-generating enzyme required for sulfatase activity
MRHAVLVLLLAGCEDAGGVAALRSMVSVPAGAFAMGTTSANSDCTMKGGDNHVRVVTLSAFDIDRTEVSQLDYQACVDAAGCKPIQSAMFDPVAHPNFPVSGVFWPDARDYCQWKGKHLPTEAQWELAARGSMSLTYPWGSQDPTCALANFDGCEPANDFGLAPVDSRPAGASPCGAVNMIGNVDEWVQDWYDRCYYTTGATTDPPGPAAAVGDSALKSTRGFSVQNFSALEAFRRGNAPIGGTSDYQGFRCAN